MEIIFFSGSLGRLNLGCNLDCKLILNSVNFQCENLLIMLKCEVSKTISQSSIMNFKNGLRCIYHLENIFFFFFNF